MGSWARTRPSRGSASSSAGSNHCASAMSRALCAVAAGAARRNRGRKTRHLRGSGSPGWEGDALDERRRRMAGSVHRFKGGRAASRATARDTRPRAGGASEGRMKREDRCEIAGDLERANATEAPTSLTHLQRLEAECERPVMLYSIGKDSGVMLHIAKKAFHPSVPPFPLLHVDTTWKFRAMYEMRDRMARETGMPLLVHRNSEAAALGINPFTHGSQLHTDMWKTQGLKQALELHGFDAAFGGARRDEEKSRAKERIFSFRNSQHRWDPKNQRPE